MSPLLERPADVHVRGGAQELEYDAIAARLARDRPGRLLDWGAGIGQVAARLEEHGLDVRAYDYEADLGGSETRPLPRHPQLSVDLSSDPVALPYEDGAFDAVLSCGVLEHVAHPDRSLDEIRRVLRPGGVLYVYKLPNRSSYLELVARAIGLYYHGKLPHDAVYSPASACRLLERHGYAVRELRYANMLPLTLASRPAVRLAPLLWAANRALARVPLLSRLATNVELVAVARP